MHPNAKQFNELKGDPDQTTCHTLCTQLSLPMRTEKVWDAQQSGVEAGSIVHCGDSHLPGENSERK